MKHPYRLAAASAGVAAIGAHSAPASTFLPRVRRFFPALSGTGRSDHVAITFDDGPDNRGTPELLEILESLDLRATFFLLGSMVTRHPAVARQIRDAGHEIGLHGWHHQNSLRVPPLRLRRSLNEAIAAIDAATDVRPVFYRPPYGIVTAGTLWAARSLGLTTVLWTAWGKDWEGHATPQGVHSNVIRTLQPGGTILLHDSDCTSAPNAWRSTLGAVPTLVAELRAQGLTVGPLREHSMRSVSARTDRARSSP